MLPKTLPLCNVEFTVREVPLVANEDQIKTHYLNPAVTALGYCDLPGTTLQIKSTLPPWLKVLTLFHEAVHAAATITGLNLQEGAVVRISESLYAHSRSSKNPATITDAEIRKAIARAEDILRAEHDLPQPFDDNIVTSLTHVFRQVTDALSTTHIAPPENS